MISSQIFSVHRIDGWDRSKCNREVAKNAKENAKKASQIEFFAAISMFFAPSRLH
jgi:hypothetical protein